MLFRSRLQPDFAGAHTTLAAVLREQGDAAGAATESKAASEISKSVYSLQGATFATNSGKRLMQAGDLDGAIGQFRSAIQLAPEFAPAHQQLGLGLQRKGAKDESEKELRKAGELDPRFASAKQGENVPK